MTASPISFVHLPSEEDVELEDPWFRPSLAPPRPSGFVWRVRRSVAPREPLGDEVGESETENDWFR